MNPLRWIGCSTPPTATGNSPVKILADVRAVRQNINHVGVAVVDKSMGVADFVLVLEVGHVKWNYGTVFQRDCGIDPLDWVVYASVHVIVYSKHGKHFNVILRDNRDITDDFPIGF